MSWIDRLIQTEDAMVAQAVARERERIAKLADQWLEWLDGMYDGRDLLRRVKLAVHGPLRKPGTSGVGGRDGS